MSKTSKQQLVELATRLRESADEYRKKADYHDRHSCAIEFLSSLEEDAAKLALVKLMEAMPSWFTASN